MRAITAPTPGGPESLVLAEQPDPEVGEGEVRIAVTAAGVNRADLLQAAGHYPPPPGVSDVLGLEVSGTIESVGPGVDQWLVGDRVCALLAGGGYAELVTVPAGQVLPLPTGVGMVEAAALPEVACTVWSNLVLTAGLRAGETVLVHGGSSGIGTMAIQVAKALGARVAVTAGTEDKLEACRGLGADILVNYRESDFVAEVRAQTGGRGVDVVLDNMGAAYLARNVQVLATGGRLVVIGLQGGTRGELDLGLLLRTRGSVHATSLRSRPVAEKSAIVREVRNHLWPLVASGAVRPVVHGTHPLADAAAAHRELAGSSHIGKVLLLT